jgi:N-acetylmuramoyl-L-alanine amidase
MTALALALTLSVGPALAGAALAADPTVTVRPGDTLTAIAKRHGVSVRTIVDLNGLPDPNRIFPGQQLRIGTDAGAAAPAPVAEPAPAATATTHVVARGENLTRIARHYGVSVAAIVAANGIANPNRIVGGQRLSIPGAPPQPGAAVAQRAPAVATGATHVVARGENLTRIGRHYGVSVAAIVAANGIANPSRIFPGQRLSIPGAPAVPAAPAAAPAAQMPASMAALVARREGVRAMITEEANRYGVPVALALAVAWQESGWRQDVVSSAGAIGIMQLLPATAEWVGGSMLGEGVAIHDARHNVRAGVRLLAHYLVRYDGNRELVLAAYYQGQAATDRHGIYGISRPYIASILRLVTIFGG